MWFSWEVSFWDKYKSDQQSKGCLLWLVEKPKAGQCEKASQGSVAEEILGNEGEYLSRFNSGVLHKLKVWRK